MFLLDELVYLLVFILFIFLKVKLIHILSFITALPNMSESFLIHPVNNWAIYIQNIYLVFAWLLILIVIPLIWYKIIQIQFWKIEKYTIEVSFLKKFIFLFHLVLISVWYIVFILKTDFSYNVLPFIIILWYTLQYMYQRFLQNKYYFILSRFIILSVILQWVIFIINSLIWLEMNTLTY